MQKFSLVVCIDSTWNWPIINWVENVNLNPNTGSSLGQVRNCEPLVSRAGYSCWLNSSTGVWCKEINRACYYIEMVSENSICHWKNRQPEITRLQEGILQSRLLYLIEYISSQNLLWSQSYLNPNRSQALTFLYWNTWRLLRIMKYFISINFHFPFRGSRNSS